MKITRTLGGIGLVLLLGLSGCFGNKLSEPTSRDYDTYTGEFKSLAGIRVNKSITHLFETDEGDILYAYSDRYDLSDERYLDARVEAYGLVLNYEEMDKPVFEVRRISEASEEANPEEVTMVPYKDTQLGISFEYPSNWTLNAEISSALLLSAPELEASPSDIASSETKIPDYISFNLIPEVLKTTNDTPKTERLMEVKTWATSESLELSNNVSGEEVLVGPDQVAGVKFNTTSGNAYYYIPRGADLLEVSLGNGDGDASSGLQVFGSIMASFRFLPQDGSAEVAPEESPLEPSMDQVSFTKYSTFSSKAYAFEGSYPSPWFYSGNNGGYDFAAQSLEKDDTEVLIRLDINSGQPIGVVKQGEKVQVTVDFNGKAFSFSGAPEYQDVMQQMAKSLKALPTE